MFKLTKLKDHFCLGRKRKVHSLYNSNGGGGGALKRESVIYVTDTVCKTILEEKTVCTQQLRFQTVLHGMMHTKENKTTLNICACAHLLSFE